HGQYYLDSTTNQVLRLSPLDIFCWNGWHSRSQVWGGAYLRAYLQAYLRKANRRPDFLPP
ncbi:MAG: hypothetical protein NWS96_11680, partial [Pseudomonadales bacterium]|nr:hypothetical protein [Pseudomonadales bacterium]MDP4639218.1 hypothetical protein [Pseudomonadales bacterium]MDP4911394.1 hypothetical protein [Pseudomonadales bacterium]